MDNSYEFDAAELDDLLSFAPVLMQRRRANGWSAERQRRFVTALSVMGAVGPAARAVGMGRASAYRLRERAGAEGFAEAWDIALAMGADMQFEAAMHRAVNGVTTLRVMRGGAIEVANVPDRKLLNAALFSNNGRFPSAPGLFPAFKATKDSR
jgi:hypothetical protein